MGDRTAIEWTRAEDGTAGASWNPIRYRHENGKSGWYCEKISPGCDNCYASTLSGRWHHAPFPTAAQAHHSPVGVIDVGSLYLDETVLTQPLRWKRPRRIFVCSMTDLFLPEYGAWVERIVDVMARAHWHTFMVLTKRAKEMRDFSKGLTHYDWSEYKGERDSLALLVEQRPKGSGRPIAGWPPNVRLGVTIEEDRFHWRARYLLQCETRLPWVSIEPMLGPVRLLDRGYLRDHSWEHGTPGGIGWVVAGGESAGPWVERGLVYPRETRTEDGHYRVTWGPKPEALAWVRRLRDECQTAGVPWFWKQWGGPTPKSGGRLVDGREWNEQPASGTDGVYHLDDDRVPGVPFGPEHEAATMFEAAQLARERQRAAGPR